MQTQLARKIGPQAETAQAKLPAGRPIDLVHLSRQTLGDRALEIELLGLFEKQAGQIIARLGSGLCGSDSKWRNDLAHTLKGSARAVGAMRVAAAAENYENSLNAGAGHGEIAQRVGELKAAVEEARQCILDLLADA